jgi:hypothetical protein
MKITFISQKNNKELKENYYHLRLENNTLDKSSSEIYLNKEFMFLDLVSFGKSLNEITSDIYLNLTDIPNLYKLMIVHILVKQIYRFKKFLEKSISSL